MSFSSCERCHTKISSRKAYIAHLKNRDCETAFSNRSKEEILQSLNYRNATETIECEHCHTLFQNTILLGYHYSICQVKQSKDNESKIFTEREMQVKNELINELEGRLGNLTQIIDHKAKRLNAFGHENTFYIDQNYTFVENCIQGKFKGIIQYILHKHFNNEHPENHNIRLKQKCFSYFNGITWRDVSREYLIDKLIEDFEYRVLDFMREHNVTKTSIIQNSHSILNTEQLAYIRNFIFKVSLPLKMDNLMYEFDTCIPSMSDKELVMEYNIFTSDLIKNMSEGEYRLAIDK